MYDILIQKIAGEISFYLICINLISLVINYFYISPELHAWFVNVSMMQVFKQTILLEV